MKNLLISLFTLTLAVFLPACDDGEKTTNNNTNNTNNVNNHTYTFMTGDVADCEFDVLTFQTADGTPVEVSLNGLPVEDLDGVNKLSLEEFEVVARRGVRMSEIFTRAGITMDDSTPVNCIARDGYDVLRAKLGSDTAALPTFAFMRDHGYIYVGGAGDKDPLFPEMEGRTLMVDYDLTEDVEVPQNLGAGILAMNMYRYKMVEKVDAAQRGLFELNPVVE
ncbi:hypothetical protein KJ975_02930 [Myxococcota bacterium]|nr:hypothetical protein [Myxococcota bacterium]